MTGNLPITFGSLPPGSCYPEDPNDLLRTFAQNLTVSWSLDFSLINVGSTVPDPENQDRPWFRINEDGTPDRWYWFYNGSWISPHTVRPGIMIECVDANGVPTDPGDAAIEMWDGGTSGTVTSISGPFWKRRPATYGGRVHAELANTTTDPNIPIHPVGALGGTGPEGPISKAVGATGGIYNDAVFPPWIATVSAYRTNRLWYSITP